MAVNEAKPVEHERRQRDPERTKLEILEVATQEFADRGFAGARVDEIAARTRTTKRMIYYYFGSKELLYITALEKAYETIRITEQSVDIDNLDPVAAVRKLAELTFDRHEANPNFSRLVSHENTQRAQFINADGGFPGLDRPVIKMLQRSLDQGRSEGIFHRDIDVFDVHMLISSFCFFRINNQYTFAANFNRNLVDSSRRAMYRRMIGDVVVQYLLSSPE